MEKKVNTKYVCKSLPYWGDLEGQNPNPAKDYFIVRYKLDNNYADVIIQLTDISGRID